MTLSLAFDLLTRGAGKAADDLGQVGDASDRTGRKVDNASGSMKRMAGVLSEASGGALDPLQDLAGRLEELGYQQESLSKKIGAGITNLGVIGLTAGGALQALADRERLGERQLDASLKAAGSSYALLQDDIDAAVDSGHHFGERTTTTLDALNQLVLSTHDSGVALKDLAAAHDVAAGAGVSLAAAADIVARAYEGDAEVAKRWGLQLENVKSATDGLTKAQAESQKAGDRVTRAQQAYSDKLAVYRQTLSPTLAQQQALYRSHQNVVRAQDDAAAAAGRLRAAQQVASDAAGAGARNVEQLARVFKGQGEASADSYSGKLQALGARIEDTITDLGEKYGGALSTASLATIAFGTVIESGLGGKLVGLIGKLGLTGAAFKTLRDVQVVTSAEGAAAVTAAAATEGTALAAAGAAGTAAGVSVAAGFTAMLGPIGVATAAVAGFLYLLRQKELNPEHIRNLNLGTPSATIALPRQNPVIDFNGQKFAANGSGLVPALPPLRPHGVQTDDVYDAKTSATLGQRLAMSGQRAKAVADAAGKAHKDTVQDEFQKWLKAMGLGDPANSILKAAAAEAARVARQAAIDGATAIRDAVKSEFEKAKAVLADVQSQAKSLRESISQSLREGAQITDVFGTGPNLNANHAFGSGADFERVRKFFETRLISLKRFAAQISALVHKGLDPAIVAQIAQAGVDQGGRLADALSGASKSQLGQITSLNRQVTQIADSAGRRVADVQFREQLASSKRNADMLGRKLDEANRHLKVLTRSKPGGSSVDQRAAAFVAGA